MATESLLVQSAIYLGAAVVAVPLAQRLGLGSVLGYLLAGIAIGPWGSGLIQGAEAILHFAEFGVVLLLFLIGLELHPKRLWAMRRPILGLGGLQVGLTTLVLWGAGVVLGLSVNAALIVAMGLSLSSTAIALQTLEERNLLATHAGRSAFAVLLFQDLSVIPMLALLPLLGAATGGAGAPIGLVVLHAVGAIGGVVVVGHYLIQPVLRIIAGTRLREVFTAFALFLVVGIALLMDLAGLSMALGAFLAGVLLAESEYRHELEVEIQPFKGLLLGLFFIAVGMSADFSLFLTQPLALLAATLGLVAIKLALLGWLAGRGREPIAPSQRALFAFVLGQGGEFAFVLFSAAATLGGLERGLADFLVVVVTLSMLTTPLLVLVYERFIAPRHLVPGAPRQTPEDAIDEGGNPVIIAGFGRFGRVVGRLLHANGIGTTILDHDPDQIEEVRRYGYKVYYGDALRPDTLRAAGAEHARLLIITVDDPEAALRLTELARSRFPHLRVYARARDMHHAAELVKRDVTVFQRELLESALRLGEDALRELGVHPYRARQAVHRFRDHDRKLMYALIREEGLERRISITRQAREELEKVLAVDEAALEQRQEDWD